MKSTPYYRGMSNDSYNHFKKKRRYKRRTPFFLLLLLTILIIAAVVLVLYFALRGDESELPAASSSSAAASETESELASETEPGAESNVESGVESRPGGPLTTDFSEWNKNCDWTMPVVNYQNAMTDDIQVTVGKYDVIDIDERILQPLTDMIAAAGKDGVTLWISSGYRSIETQQVLFDREVQKHLDEGKSQKEAEELAATVVAYPGTSEHNLGLAVDLNGVRNDFYQTETYRWLSEHSAEYGFIERYPDGKQEITGVIFEPWHYRYVGVENAQKIEASGLCLEEYVDALIKGELQ